MSNKIDQRIVEMSFENHKFEKGILESKNSLKEFSNALKNTGTGKSFNGLEDSIGSISRSFSMMEQIGIGALRRIGEMAVNAGSKLVKNLSVDQLTAGLGKYQEKIEAVQTMVSAGYDFEEVEKSMQSLMWFSDETSYSFSDMAGNMAKFIASGVDLKTSEKAMKGIATWAAHSGKNTQAASIAMFNLSQAISMGYVDTMNWRSIMNQNMNTVMFKEIAIGVAEATGAIQKGQVTIQNFDTNLREKWFTNDVLLKTLEQYGAYSEKVKEVQDEMGFYTAARAMEYMDEHAEKYADILGTIGNAAFKAAQESKSFHDSIEATKDAVSSGWLQTYEIIFGTLNEAKANFSALTEILWQVFASGGEDRNELLKDIKELGGISDIFQTLKNTAIALLKPLQAVSRAFDSIFPPKTAEQWAGMIGALKNFTKNLIISDETADKIQRTFRGLFSVLDLGWTTVKFLGSAFLEIIRVIIPFNGSFLELTANIGDFLYVFTQIIKQSGVFEAGMKIFRTSIISIRDVLVGVISFLFDFVDGLLSAENPIEHIGKAISKMFGGIIQTIKMVSNVAFDGFINALKNLSDFIESKFGEKNRGIISGFLGILKDFIDFIVDKATGGIGDFGEVLKTLDFGKITAVATGGILLLFINQLTQMLGAMTKITNAASGFVTKFSKKLFGSQLKIKELAISIGILAGSLYVLSQVPWEQLKTGLKGLAWAIGIFIAAYGAFQLINVGTTKLLKGSEMVKSSLNLMGMASGLLIMAGALKIITSIKSEDIGGAVKVLDKLLVFLVSYQAAYALISTIPGQGKLSASLVGMSAGLLGLMGVLKLLHSSELDNIRDGLGKLAEILLVMSGMQILFSVAARITGGHKLATSMLGLSGGILAILGVMKILSNIDLSTMSQGINNLFGIGLIMAALEVMFGVAAMISGGNKLKSHILSISIGMGAMIALIAILNSRPEGEFDNGIKKIAKMTGIIVAIELLTATAARIAGGAKVQRILGAVTLTLLSFTGVIAILGALPKGVLDQGMVAIERMVLMIGAIQFMTAMAASISGDASMFMPLIGMSVAIIALTGSLALLSTMVDQEALRQTSISLGIAAVAIGVMGAGIGLMTKGFSLMSENLKGLAGIKNVLLTGLLVLGAVLIGTVALLGTIKMVSAITRDMTWNDIAIFAAGMAAVTTLIIAFSKLANTESGSWKTSLQSLVPGFVGAAAAIVATAGMFYAIKAVLPIIQGMDWNDLGKFVTGLGVVSLLIAGMTLLDPAFQALGAGFPAVLAGIATAIVGVGIVVLAFGVLAVAFEKIFGGSDTLEKGIEKLISLAGGIGRFVGAVFGGFNMEFLTQTGEGLAQFAESISRIKSVSFGDGVKGLGNAVTIAKDIKKFVKALKDVDFSIVDPAMDALNRVNETFAGFGGAALVSAMESFNANKLPFQAIMLDFLNSTISTVSQKRDELVTVFSNLFRNAVRQSTVVIDDFRQLGANIVFGLRDGIIANKSEAVNAMIAMSNEVLLGSKRTFDIHSPSRESYKQGQQLPRGTMMGIKHDTNLAVAASGAMAQDVLDIADETLGQNAFTVGKNYIARLGNGMKDGAAGLKYTGTSAALKLANTLGIDLKGESVNGLIKGFTTGESSVTKKIGGVLETLGLDPKIIESVGGSFGSLGKSAGSEFTDNYSSTLQGVGGASAAATKDAFEIFKEGINKRKEYNVMFMDEEIRLWEEFAKKYAEGTQIRLKADKEIGRLKYENSKRWIDREKYYKRLSLQDELAAWERVQARYEWGHQYRLEAEREIFRLKQEIWKAEYQNAVDWIDDEKYYGRLNLTDELSKWKEIRNIAEENSDERKKTDREIFRLEKEISETNLAYEEKLYALEKERNDKRKQLEDDYYNKTKEIKNKLAQDIKSLEDNYENAVASRAQALYSTHGLFDKVEKPEYVSGFDLINNLEDQVMEFDKWQSSIATLADKGINDGLISELRDMGPQSLAQIRALNRMTKPELDRYVTLWSKKNNEAKTQAVDELRPLKDETSLEIKRLTRAADKELDYYNKVWEDSLRELNAENKKQLQILEKEWKTNLGQITAQGMKIIQQFRLDWFGEIATMIADTNTQMSNLQKATQVAKAASSAAVVGASIGKGLGGGIVGTTGAVIGAATSLIGSALTAMKKTAKTNSPSKEGIWIGEYIGIGLADGLHNTLSTIAKEGITMGQTALDSISMFTEDIPDLLDDDSNSFTIQPVLDLTNVRSGLDNMSLLLNDFPRLDSKAIMQLLPLENGSSDDILLLNDIRDTLKTIGDKEVDLTGMLTVQVINDKGEIVSIAQTAIKDMLRRESR